MDDLYDYEIVEIWEEILACRAKWVGKPDTVENLREMGKEIEYKLSSMGYKVRVNVELCAVYNPATGRNHDPEIELFGRLEERAYDHDRKRKEVLESKKRGEKYRGLRERTPGHRT